MIVTTTINSISVTPDWAARLVLIFPSPLDSLKAVTQGLHRDIVDSCDGQQHTQHQCSDYQPHY